MMGPPDVKVSPSKKSSKSKNMTPPEPDSQSNPFSQLLGGDLVLTSKTLGSGRKFSAENGKSQQDWMRRTSQDIPIRRPVLRPIPPDELKSHNKKSDCWMALRGHVYDCTDYVPFHPGGVSEIMKGAGIDATALFNSIHRYVNFESLLEGNEVGVYTRRASITTENEEQRAVSYIANSMNHRDSVGSVNSGEKLPKKKCWCKICDLCKGNNKPEQDNLKEIVPLTSFKEDDNYAIYKISINGFKYNKDYWSVCILEKEKLLLKVITKPPDVWMAYFQLTNPILDDKIKLDFSNGYKNLIVKIPKPQKVLWSKLGQPLPDHNEIEDCRRAVEDMVPACIAYRKEIAKDFYFASIKLSPCGRLGIPVGFDIKIRIDGVARRYTPVCTLFPQTWEIEDPDRQVIHLMYKLYPDGSLTPKLTSLDVQCDCDTLHVGASSGNFDTEWFQGADAIIFLAGGSGITPYIRILQFIKEHNIALGIDHVILLFWNKVEAEIVWKEEFENLMKTKRWFHFLPILTRADGSWTGLRGRVSAQLLNECLGKIPSLTTEKSRIKWMSCGSDGFNTSGLEAIQAIGHLSDQVFVFLG